MQKPSFSTVLMTVALAISTVAEIYAIIGLATIFAGAQIPVMIFGALLGIGKIVTVIWLRKNWNSAPFFLKSYLFSAAVILSVLTSIGIFGFLSKAHTVSGLAQTGAVLKIEQIDSKIASITTSMNDKKESLALMTKQVNAVMERGTDVYSVNRSVNIRKSQTTERNLLQKEIDEYSNQLVKLNEEKAPYTVQLKTIEAEVGPLKYIAQLVYGSAEQNMLEKAVQYMTVILVLVFDPLAIALVLAAGYAKDHEVAVIVPVAKKKYTRKKKVETESPKVETVVEGEPKKKRPYKKKIKVVAPINEVVDAGISDSVKIDLMPVKRAGSHSLADEVSGITRRVIKSNNEVVIYEGKSVRREDLKQKNSKLFMTPLEESMSHKHYDWLFPVVAANGEVMTRIDCIPHRMYQFNDGTWKLINERSQHDCVSDPEYITQVKEYLNSNPTVDKKLYE